MASNPLFSALESVFEEEGAGPNLAHQPLTIRAVIRLLENWTPGPSSELAGRVQQMRDRVREAAQQSEEELQVDQDEELQGYQREMLTIYQGMQASLQRARGALDSSDAEQVAAEARELHALLDALNERDSSIQEWLARPVLRCPRCGRSEEGATSCSRCHLELLYPGAVPRASRSVQLGPEYTAAFEAWSAVVNGEASLRSLWASLDPLEALLRRYLRMTERELSMGLVGEKLSQTLQRIALASQRSLEGLAQMRSAESSKRMLDVNEGWTLVFEQAVEIQESIPELAGALGGKSSPSPSGATQDSLLIDFD